MDGLSLGQMASTGPDSRGWGIFFMWEEEISTRNRCGWVRELLIFLVSLLKDGGHGVYTQKFRNPLQFILCIKKKEPIQKILL